MASTKTSKQLNAIPSLLDRLSESPSSDVSNATLERGELPDLDVESGILRDLGWLLNSTSLSSTTDLSQWPNVQRSVLNYGVGVLTGRVFGTADAPQLASDIKKRITIYEPRLRRDSLTVHVSIDGDDHDHRQIHIRIDGEYAGRGQSLPIAMDLCVDTDTGCIQIES